MFTAPYVDSDRDHCPLDGAAYRAALAMGCTAEDVRIFGMQPHTGGAVMVRYFAGRYDGCTFIGGELTPAIERHAYPESDNYVALNGHFVDHATAIRRV